MKDPSYFGKKILVILGAIIIFAVGANVNAQISGLKDKLSPKVEKVKLTTGDIEPKLSSLNGTEFDPFKDKPVEYLKTGMPHYDDFFKKSAIAYGSLLTAQKVILNC